MYEVELGSEDYPTGEWGYCYWTTPEGVNEEVIYFVYPHVEAE